MFFLIEPSLGLRLRIFDRNGLRFARPSLRSAAAKRGKGSSSFTALAHPAVLIRSLGLVRGRAAFFKFGTPYYLHRRSEAIGQKEFFRNEKGLKTPQNVRQAPVLVRVAKLYCASRHIYGVSRTKYP